MRRIISSFSAAVGRRSILEGIDVVLDGLNRDLEVLGAFNEHGWVVDSLSAGGDLLTAHEEVVRVRVVRISRVQHCVERSGCSRIAVKHVEVGAELFLHDLAKSFLILSGEVLERLLLDAGLLQHLDTITEVELDRTAILVSLADEVIEGVLCLDGRELLGVALLGVREDVDEHVAEQVQHLEVVLLDNHLHIKPSEFSQVTISVAVLGAEHWSDLEDTLHVSTQGHLLVELG